MEKYNGWKNYETFMFILHYGDFLYESYKDLKKLDPELDAVKFVEDFIESILIDEIPSNISGFFSSVIRASIDLIDVERIAESLLED